MCDESQLADWAAGVLSRRQFGALSGVAALAACALAEMGSASLSTVLREHAVSFPTVHGTMDAFFVHPASGRHPAVILWPDIAGIRESKRNIARALAGEGFAVLVLNPYYRDVAGEQFADFAAFISAGGFQKVGPWRARLVAGAIMRDAAAAVEWLDRQSAVDTARGIGTQGYCMGGPFAVWSAVASPRIKAAASFHGGGLVRPDDPMSPHNLLRDADTALLIAVAKDDDAKAPRDKTVFAEAAKAAGVAAEVKVYPADHGWMVPDSPAYDAAAAAQGEADLLALYRRALG